ncbi:MAG: VOC family protein [Ilumatobacteraceae bacterium]
MNAFEQLRRTEDLPASRPDPRFAARLRNQIEAALAPIIELPEREAHVMTDTAATTDTTSTATVQVLVPYLAVADAAAALDWYTAALDGTETVRYVGDDGRIGHAEMIIHGARIMLSDAYPEIGVVAADSYEGSSCALHLEVTDVDAVHASVVEHGGVAQRDPADQPHGSRMSTVVDPFGHRWMLSQTIATPTAAEIDAAMSGFTIVESPSAPAESKADGVPGGVGDRPIQLGYYTIHTNDIARAATFYSRVFGWDVDPVSGHVGNCDLPFGFQTDHGDGVRLWMQVSDADPVIARVLELGGEVIEDVLYASGRGVECRDDQGNRFDLHHPAPGYE